MGLDSVSEQSPLNQAERVRSAILSSVPLFAIVLWLVYQVSPLFSNLADSPSTRVRVYQPLDVNGSLREQFIESHKRLKQRFWLYEHRETFLVKYVTVFDTTDGIDFDARNHDALRSEVIWSNAVLALAAVLISAVLAIAGWVRAKPKNYRLNWCGALVEAIRTIPIAGHFIVTLFRLDKLCEGTPTSTS
jgi:ABC-type amino acid transport system permease subunit